MSDVDLNLELHNCLHSMENICDLENSPRPPLDSIKHSETHPNTRRQVRSRKRAHHACARCRSRKVRCDVAMRGPPCSNCSWEDIECMDALKEKKNCVVSRSKKVKMERSQKPREESAILVPKERYAIEDESLSPQLLVDGESSSLSYHDATSPIPRCPAVLPPPFLPLSPTLSEDDIEYLKKTDALSLPPRQLQKKLFQSYTRSVHPHIPFLDLRHFASVLSHQSCSNRTSLLLFQAVMLAGCASVSLQHLRSASFQTHTHTQTLLFHRVKLLYDFGVETDPLAVIQALLLMSQCRPSLAMSGTKDRWHWLGLAISMALRIGLNHGPAACTVSSDSETGYHDVRRLRQRVWWSCFMSDRLVAVMEGKPTRMRKEDCSAALLRIEDLDVDRPIEGTERGEGELSTGDLRDVAESFVAKVLICWAFDDQTPRQSAIAQEPPDFYAIDTLDTIFRSLDAPTLEDDYWADEMRGSSSSYTKSTRTESVATGNTQSGLDSMWTSELSLENYSELLLSGEDVAIEIKTGYGDATIDL